MQSSKRMLASILILAAAPLTVPAWGSPAGNNSLDAVLQDYGTLLSRYVTPAGVRYSAWRAKPEDVDAIGSVVSRLSAMDIKSLSQADRTALYIDLYNARVLQIILKENPKSSIKDITPGITGFGVFLKPAVKLGTESLTLRQLEDRLRAEAKDPRVHFAVNCASRSCPPIASEPYRGATLSEQLDRSARAFLASPGAVILKDEKSSGGKETVTVEASKIFDWYEKDFKATGGPLAFIEKYGPPNVADALKKAGGGAKLTAQTYDWSLNSAS